MKKILSALVLTSLVAVFVPAVVLAQAPTVVSSIDDIIDLIDKAGDIAFAGLMVLAAVLLIMAGYLFVTAGGDPEKVDKARKTLIFALIGVGVGVLAKGLVLVVMKFLGYTPGP